MKEEATRIHHREKRNDSQIKSGLRLIRPPLTQAQRGLEEHQKFRKQNK